MPNLPELSAHGYQITKELGHNLEGGRYTYLAKRLTDSCHVVVKQFQFSTGTKWDGFRAIEREIQSLQGLSHRGIPKYLDKFETDNGYCLVTEYFPADTLAVGRSFTPDQIKQIAVQLLEILVYLQERIPPVIHRDIKPENILVDGNFNVYLIDFGFARVGSGSVAMSSANAGTFGFMAPEQIRNLKLTNASDLYGLGLTLICLIGAIRSTNIGNYIDFSNQLDRSKIDPKLKGCSLRFIDWLSKMVEPQLEPEEKTNTKSKNKDKENKYRYPDAKTALEALKPLYVVRAPQVEFNKQSFIFETTTSGGKIPQEIRVKNSTPETILDGKWEVISSSGNSSSNYNWISVSPQKFTSNEVVCEITVDTSELIKEPSGNYSIELHTNALPVSYKFPLEYTLIYPSIKISESNLHFKANHLGQKINQPITISNSFPKAVLEGKLSVAPHRNDPGHSPDSHEWISFSPKEFKGNSIKCEITVDTSKLIAQSQGEREILLHSNAISDQKIKLKVSTSSFPVEVERLPNKAIILLSLNVMSATLVSHFSKDINSFLSSINKNILLVFGDQASRSSITQAISNSIILTLASTIPLTIIILIGMSLIGYKRLRDAIGKGIVWLNIVVFFTLLLFGYFKFVIDPLLLLSLAKIVVTFNFFAIVSTLGAILLSVSISHTRKFYYAFLTLLVIIFGCGLGLNTELLKNPLLLVGTITSGGLFTYILINPYRKYYSEISDYRKREQHLIKP